MSPYLQTLLTAMTPIGELRAAIPLAVSTYGLTLERAYIVSVIGNLIPVILLLLFLPAVSVWLSARVKIWDRFFTWLFARTRNRIANRYETAGYLALVIFVAIPLPMTGAWSGAAAAYLLGIPFWKALGLIAAGVAIAGIIVALLTFGVSSIV